MHRETGSGPIFTSCRSISQKRRLTLTCSTARWPITTAAQRRSMQRTVKAGLGRMRPEQWMTAGQPTVRWSAALTRRDPTTTTDRKSVVSGKSVSVRVDLGGRRIIKKKKKMNALKRNNNIRAKHKTYKKEDTIRPSKMKQE